MKYDKLFLILAAVAVAAAMHAQTSQTSVQTDAQAGNQASVQAGKTSAQTSSSSSASSSASANSRQANAGLASGSTFNAALTSPVDSKKCRPGDPVHARTTEPAKSDGKTVLPRGTKLVGHVTQASSRANGDSESALGITFDRAILKDGEEVPLNVAVQAIASAQSVASSNDLDTMGAAGGGVAGSGMASGRSGGGGLVSTAGGAVGAVTNAASSVGGVAGGVDSTLSSATGVAAASQGAVGGLNAAGQLASNSRGVFGMNGLNLTSAAASDAQGSVITSPGKNVHLDSGTRMLMVTQNSATPTP